MWPRPRLLFLLTFVLKSWRHVVDQEVLSTPLAAIDTGDRLLAMPLLAMQLT